MPARSSFHSHNVHWDDDESKLPADDESDYTPRVLPSLTRRDTESPDPSAAERQLVLHQCAGHRAESYAASDPGTTLPEIFSECPNTEPNGSTRGNLIVSNNSTEGAASTSGLDRATPAQWRELQAQLRDAEQLNSAFSRRLRDSQASERRLKEELQGTNELLQRTEATRERLNSRLNVAEWHLAEISEKNSELRQALRYSDARTKALKEMLSKQKDTTTKLQSDASHRESNLPFSSSIDTLHRVGSQVELDEADAYLLDQACAKLLSEITSPAGFFELVERLNAGALTHNIDVGGRYRTHAEDEYRPPHTTDEYSRPFSRESIHRGRRPSNGGRSEDCESYSRA